MSEQNETPKQSHEIVEWGDEIEPFRDLEGVISETTDSKKYEVPGVGIVVFSIEPDNSKVDTTKPFGYKHPKIISVQLIFPESSNTIERERINKRFGLSVETDSGQSWAIPKTNHAQNTLELSGWHYRNPKEYRDHGSGGRPPNPLTIEANQVNKLKFKLTDLHQMNAERKAA